MSMTDEDLLEGMDFLNELLDRYKKYRNYYGDQYPYEETVSGVGGDYHVVFRNGRGLTQEQAVEIMLALDLRYVALTLNRYKEESWLEFLQEILPAREAQLRRDRQKAY